MRYSCALRKTLRLSWGDFHSKYEITKGNLNHHLKILQAAGLIRNFSKDEPASLTHSFYETTPIAKRVIDGIYDAFEIQPQPRILATPTQNSTPDLTPLGPTMVFGAASGQISPVPVVPQRRK